MLSYGDKSKKSVNTAEKTLFLFFVVLGYFTLLKTSFVVIADERTYNVVEEEKNRTYEAEKGIYGELIDGMEVALSPETSQSTESGGDKYTRKSITYLKMVMKPSLEEVFKVASFLAGIDLYNYLEKKIRKAVEIERFDYNPVNLSGSVDIRDLAKLVKEYVDKVKVERAKAEAEMDWRFKDLVVTAEDLRRIANSAYIYWPEVEKFKVWYIVKFPLDKKEKIEQEIQVQLGVRVKYYRVDFETGEPIKVADIYAEHLEVVKVGRESLILLPFPLSLLSPQVKFPEDPFSAFERCTAKVIEWLSKKINAETRRIPDFKLADMVVSSDSFYVSAPITAKEGLKVDWDFEVIEKFSKNGGEGERRVGWVRARKIADGKVDKTSRFQIIGGRAGIGHTIREYPLVGVGLLIIPGYLMSNEIIVDSNNLKFQGIEGVNSGKGGFGFSVRGRLNLATAFGLKISELYLFGGGQLNFIRGGSGEVLGDIGLRKKFYIRSLAIIPEIPFNFGTVSVPIKVNGEETLASASIIGISPSLSLEWFFHPRFSIFAGGGMRFLSETSDFSYEKDGNEIPVSGITYKPSTPFFFGGLEFTLW